MQHFFAVTTDYVTITTQPPSYSMAFGSYLAKPRGFSQPREISRGFKTQVITHVVLCA
jgi:hypothetical protein